MQHRSRTACAVAPWLIGLSSLAFAQQTTTREATSALELDSYTPGSCSPNGQAHGACPQGELVRIRVLPIAVGLTQPFHMAFLPNGRDLLVTEGPGRLRIIRDGVLEPKPVAGWPVAELRAGTLNSVLVHPQFAQNGFIYLSYVKGREDGMTPIGLARGKLGDAGLTGVKDVFVADAWIKGPLASRAAFAPDGTTG